MIKELSPYQLAARRRRDTRIIGENGKWFSTECPPDKHGTSGGAVYWCCQCDKCLDFNRQAARNTYNRKKHNRRIMLQMQWEREKNLESIAEDSAPAPEEAAASTVDPFPDESPTGAPDPVAAPSGPVTWEEAANPPLGHGSWQDWAARFRRSS